MSQQSSLLNSIIQDSSQAIFDLLSQNGKEAYSPKEGILSQSQEAKTANINATIGISTKDNGVPMHFEFMDDIIKIEPEQIYPYSSSTGDPKLREKWSQHIKKENELTTKISTPIVTSGITHSLSSAGFMFIEKGDTVITHDKYWGNYDLIFETQFGAKITTYNTFRNNSFDLISFKKSIDDSGEKIILLFNFPNNPSGYTPDEEVMKGIKKIILDACSSGKKIVSIIDDAYFGLFYDDSSTKKSLFSHLVDLHDNLITIKCDGATKEDFSWGLRVGFITFNSKSLLDSSYAALEEKLSGYVRSTVSNVSTLSQTIVLTQMNHPNYLIEKKNAFEIIKKRYLKVKEIFSTNKNFDKYFHPLPFNSGYFMCIELNSDLNAENIRRKLLQEYSTGVISQGNLLRIAFSSVPESRIEELFNNIYNACGS